MRVRSGQEGFTMLVTLGVMFLLLILGASALAAANGDIRLTGNDQDHRQALLAARAGAGDYQWHLDQDTSYWTKCAGVSSPSAVNLKGSTTNRRSLPNLSGVSYAIELVPRAGQSACSTSNPGGTMIQNTGPLANTFSIRTTGYSGGVKQSLLTTFGHASFLNYVYTSNYETSDPVVYHYTAGADGDGAVAWASTACARYYRDGRANQTYQYPFRNSDGSIAGYATIDCDEIQFVGGSGGTDQISGPLHTNDELNICGSPVFGRPNTPSDDAEVGADDPGHRQSTGNGCTDSPVFNDGITTNAPILTPPPSDAQLKTIAAAAYRFTGQTKIALGASSMTVTTGGSTTTMSYPANGVIYVSNGSCSSTFTPYGPDYSSNGCADVYVHGSYGSSLTIASEKDVIVDGNLTNANSTALLGLIANNFVRVQHPLDRTRFSYPGVYGGCNGASNATGTTSNIEIDAAMLAINHSFIVDNYDCGSPLGTLTIKGAVAQNFRGAVGTGTSSAPASGYIKNYNYDDRLLTQQPPYFLDPVQAAWNIVRQTQVPSP